MKHLKSLAILLALMLVLAVVVPAFAQDTEESTEDDDSITLVGTLELSEEGDLIFTDIDGVPYIVAPGSGFNPSEILNDFEEGTLFELVGTLLNEGDDENPATVQVGQDGSFVEYDVTTDTDADGVVDVDDNCPEDANADQLDTDLDGLGDVCDEFPDVGLDGDNDGVPDIDDNCPEVANPIAEGSTVQEFPVDTDGDGVGDACEEETDTDGDGVPDAEDNCPEVANPIAEGSTVQEFPVDTDGDGVGDACEEADDGDDDGAGEGEGGFYCRNRDIEHPAGSRIAEQYGADYADVIATFCGDEGTHKIGWGVIRHQLAAESGANTRGNGNGHGNGNGNGHGNGNGNGHGNGNGGGNGGGGGNGNGNGNGRGGK